MLFRSFNSNYTNRIPDAIANSPEINFISKSTPTKMIVVSDGDIISSYISKKGLVYPLGYDRFTRQTYGNKSFILNCIDYLCDNNAILELRAKEIKMRLLDPAKTEDATMIKWLNLLLPPILIAFFGIIFSILRKKKYSN